MCLDGGIIAALLVFVLLVVAAGSAGFAFLMVFARRWAERRSNERSASAEAGSR